MSTMTVDEFLVKALTTSVVADDVSSVREFLNKYYRLDRLAKNNVTFEEKLATYQAEFDKYGSCVISRHDSVIGESIYYLKHYKRLKSM